MMVGTAARPCCESLVVSAGLVLSESSYIRGHELFWPLGYRNQGIKGSAIWLWLPPTQPLIILWTFFFFFKVTGVFVFFFVCIICLCY